MHKKLIHIIEANSQAFTAENMYISFTTELTRLCVLLHFSIMNAVV